MGDVTAAGAVLIVPIGLLIGAVLGLVGAGGSIIAVPALVYAAGMNPAVAIPSSLIVVGLGALAAVLPRIRQGIDWTTAGVVGLAGIPAAWLGTAVNRMLDPNLLMLAFAALMVIAAVRLLSAPADPTRARSFRRRGLRARAPRALAAGALVGFLTGLLGVGGGFIIVPALTLVLGLEMSTAVGTSLVIIVINALAGVTAHLQNLTLDWPVVLSFAGAAITGSLLAARLATRLPDRQIRLAFALTILAVATVVGIGNGYALATA